MLPQSQSETQIVCITRLFLQVILLVHESVAESEFKLDLNKCLHVTCTTEIVVLRQSQRLSLPSQSNLSLEKHSWLPTVSARRKLDGNVHGAENVSLDAFPSVGNLDLAGRILFPVRWKLYKENLSVPLHISFVQKLRYVRSEMFKWIIRGWFSHYMVLSCIDGVLHLDRLLGKKWKPVYMHSTMLFSAGGCCQIHNRHSVSAQRAMNV